MFLQEIIVIQNRKDAQVKLSVLYYNWDAGGVSFGIILQSVCRYRRDSVLYYNYFDIFKSFCCNWFGNVV